MFNGDLIVRQSKFLLFITILYLKDFSNVHSSPIYNFDFDFVSDVLSLTEDFINLSKSYSNYEISKDILPQNRWIMKNKDVQLNYSQLIKKYSLSNNEPNEGNEEDFKEKHFTLYTPSNNHDNLPESRLLPCQSRSISPDVECIITYRLVSKGYEIWIGNVLLSRIKDNHSLSNFHFWNIMSDASGCLDLSEVIGILFHLAELKKILYLEHIQGQTSFFRRSSHRSISFNKISLTMALWIIIRVYRLISVLIIILVKLNNMINFLFLLFDSNLLMNNSMYLSRTILLNNILFSFIMRHNLILFTVGLFYFQIYLKRLKPSNFKSINYNQDTNLVLCDVTFKNSPFCTSYFAFEISYPLIIFHNFCTTGGIYAKMLYSIFLNWICVCWVLLRKMEEKIANILNQIDIKKVFFHKLSDFLLKSYINVMSYVKY